MPLPLLLPLPLPLPQPLPLPLLLPLHPVPWPYPEPAVFPCPHIRARCLSIARSQWRHEFGVYNITEESINPAVLAAGLSYFNARPDAAGRPVTIIHVANNHKRGYNTEDLNRSVGGQPPRLKRACAWAHVRRAALSGRELQGTRSFPWSLGASCCRLGSTA